MDPPFQNIPLTKKCLSKYVNLTQFCLALSVTAATGIIIVMGTLYARTQMSSI